jgi:hypothetical protein
MGGSVLNHQPIPMHAILKIISFLVGRTSQTPCREEIRFGHSFHSGHYYGHGGSDYLWQAIVNLWHLLLRNPQLTVASAGCALVIAICSFKLLFKNRAGFSDCVSGVNESGSSMFFCWFVVTVGTAILAFYQLPNVLPSVFHKAM